ncbi:uncharacterized protein LOC128944460 [Melozone crissalis]|uniref:uncharacterized protein LOC128944460 n=1 Tax=Melozone crissalis TaxID=40204 RepID=UPI0023DB7D96|nr:uncharacterized protein LOC128944460 [Melozone crissalis]
MGWSNTDCCATILSDTTGMPMGPTGARGSIGECQGLAEVLACARASLGVLPCSTAGSSPGAELLPSVTHRQPPQPLEPPSDSVCDPVKLKMLEDIVDTKPHTWTSQSRSFRKLARLVGASSSEFCRAWHCLAAQLCPAVLGQLLKAVVCCCSRALVLAPFGPSVAAEPAGAAQGCVGSWWCHWAGAVLCPVARQGCVLGQGGCGRKGHFSFLSLPFPFLPAVSGPQLPQTDSISPSLSWCPQWMKVTMSPLKSPGKGSSRSHKVPMPGSVQTATSPLLLAVTLGVLFALLGVLPSLSVPSPRLEVFSELHNGHCQHSATALTVTSGGSCPKHPPG